jgi:ectoine hydroxylase-related dioxygenase (phytanoyl-CoA dioxygenase family)
MYDFYRHPALVDLAEDLLGTSEIVAHSTFNARPKLPDQKWTTTPWHQDVQYYANHYQNPEDVRIEVISMWIPLQRVTEQNSCLQVAPNFYQESVLDVHQDEESGFIGLSKEDAAKLKPVTIEMERGDILCFDQFVPHRALPNASDAVRWSMDIRYESNLAPTNLSKQLGFVARSGANPLLEESCEQWLEKWKDMPRGRY